MDVFISAVPQGSVLGLNLNSTTRLFADDTMIYMTIKSDRDAKLLQDDLDTLSRWENKWMMEFHPGKCEVISITRKKKPIHYNYTLHGQQLQHAQSIKYLGVTISNDLRWNKHIDLVTAKANNTLNFVRRNINIRNSNVKQQAYKSLVRPILEYSSTVWDPTSITRTKQVEMVQRRAARFVLHRYQREASVTAMLKELDWQPLATRRRQARLTMFYKIHNQHVAVNASNYLVSKNFT